MMYDHEKSDPAIVAVKPTNKAGQPAAELAEPRAGAEGNVSQQSTGRAQYRETVSQALKRIRLGLTVEGPGDDHLAEGHHRYSHRAHHLDCQCLCRSAARSGSSERRHHRWRTLWTRSTVVASTTGHHQVGFDTLPVAVP
jgi:hypothetical protein